MDQINRWPKQLPCLCAVMRSCQELFGHFVLMSEVSSGVVFGKLPPNHASSSSLCLFLLFFSLTPFFFFFISISLCSHFITDFFSSLLLKPHICCCCYPSFRPAISRSDPFVGGVGGDHCIFNPDLDNGAVTVIFLLLGYLVLRGRPCHSHSVTPPPTLPSLLVTNYSRADQCPAMLQEKQNMSRA